MRWKATKCLLVVLIVLFGTLACSVPPKVGPKNDQSRAQFNPLNDPPIVPTPTDLIKDPKSGLLQIPTADSAPKAQKSLNQFVNTLDGFPGSTTPEVKFSVKLDPNTVSDKTIKVYDITSRGPSPVESLVFEYKDIKENGKDIGLVRIWNYAGWKPGRLFAVYVLNGLLDVEKKPVVRSRYFNFAASPRPLCVYEAGMDYNAADGTCKKPSGGKEAQGCCKTNVSTELYAFATQQVRDKYKDQAKSEDEIEKEARLEMLRMGSTLEKLRQGYDLLLQVGGFAGHPRDSIVVVWHFSTSSFNQAVFNPASSPPEVPLPTDLIKDAKTGMLNVPTSPGSSEAEKEFNTYLSSLNGWITSANTFTLRFTQEIDEESIKDGLLLFQQGAKGLELLKDFTTKYDPKTNTLTATLKSTLKRGTRYFAVAKGGANGFKNKDTSKSKAPKRSALMHLVLSTDPLCTCKGKACNFASGDTCDKVNISTFIDDPKDKKGGLTGLQKGTSFEKARQDTDKLVKAVESTGQIKRADIISIWSFSSMSMPEPTLDPTTGVIPYPNNLLFDAKKGKVAIPPQPGESPTAKALREGLNTLDGFTTQGPYYAPVEGDIDPKSVALGKSIIILDLTSGKPSVDWKVEYVATAKAIVATPTKPLKELNQYAIVAISKFDKASLKPKGGVGLKAKNGNRVAPAPFMALMRNRHPLFTDDKSTVSTLTDDLAKRAEAARLAHKPLFDTLEKQKITREDVVVAWTFRTQSITKPLVQLRALPWAILQKIDKDKPRWEGIFDPTLTRWPPQAPKANLGGWVPNGIFQSFTALDQAGTFAFKPDPTKGSPSSVPFFMTVPKGTPPKTGWPVVIFQHGILRHKSDFFAVANTFAKAGMATLAFDMIYHGARTWCTQNIHCGTKAAPGTCDAKTGKCTKGKLADLDGDLAPDASGAFFLNTANPFAARDNIRQHVIDSAAFIRSIAMGGFAGLKLPNGKAAGIVLNPKEIHLVSHSLGSLINVLLAATSTVPKRVVFNTIGSTIVDIILTAPYFKSIAEAVLKSNKVTRGTRDYYRLITTFNWILDPADPGNFAQYMKAAQLPNGLSPTGEKVPKKQFMVMLAGKDIIIPTALGVKLAKLMGVSDADLKKTTYPEQGHRFLLTPEPKNSAAATAAAHAQIATFLATGKICTPDTKTGACK